MNVFDRLEDEIICHANDDNYKESYALFKIGDVEELIDSYRCSQSKIDKAIEELEKEYENLPYIDEWYATDKQWHNYYFERNEQAEESISKAIDILKEEII